jgi:hypothetical protein
MGAATFSITALSMIDLIVTLSITKLSTSTKYHYAECRTFYCNAERNCLYAEYRYALCHYAECRYSECRGADFWCAYIMSIRSTFSFFFHSAFKWAKLIEIVALA